jgi:hypothetical protein
MSTPALVPIEQFEQMLRESDVDYEFDNGELIPLSSGTYWHTVGTQLGGEISDELHAGKAMRSRAG